MSRETEKVLKELQKYLDAHAEDAADEADVDALTERFFAEYNQKCIGQKDHVPGTADDYLDLAEQATSKKKCVEYLHKALALEPDNLDARLHHAHDGRRVGRTAACLAGAARRSGQADGKGRCVQGVCRRVLDSA